MNGKTWKVAGIVGLTALGFVVAGAWVLAAVMCLPIGDDVDAEYLP